MPEMDGVETTRRMREIIGHESAIIILTAYRWDDVLEEALQAGVDSFISKPLFVASVMEEFKSALKRAELPEMTFHDLRHVSASTMEMLGVPDKYKQERGGWATGSTMKSVYIQAFNPVRREYDQKIDDYFENITEPNKKKR